VRETRHTICLLKLDEPLERVVTAHLDHAGYRAERGDSLAAVATSDPAPAAVVIDLDSLDPGRWSEDATWLRRCGRRAPVLLLASDRMSPRRERSLGGAAVLYKPFTLGELRHRLADCLPADRGVRR
jgi:DNA-binding response OmpR family regulator